MVVFWQIDLYPVGLIHSFILISFLQFPRCFCVRCWQTITYGPNPAHHLVLSSKVLLEHSHAHVFTQCLECQSSGCGNGVEQSQQKPMAYKAKYRIWTCLQGFQELRYGFLGIHFQNSGYYRYSCVNLLPVICFLFVRSLSVCVSMHVCTLVHV